MTTATVEEVGSQLSTFLDRVAAGDHIVIVRDGKPVGTLGPPPVEAPKRMVGWAKGILTIHEDDDEHLKDFAEYMP